MRKAGAGVPQREYRKVFDSERTVHQIRENHTRQERHALRSTEVFVCEGDSNLL